MKKISKQRGFTLIEVLVALAIIAIALPALMVSIGQQLDGTAYIRDKTIAQWVALNKMAELRLANNVTGKLPENKSSGKEEVANRDWYWTVKTKRFTQEFMEDMTGVEITVRDKDDDGVSPLITFYGVMQEIK